MKDDKTKFILVLTDFFLKNLNLVFGPLIEKKDYKAPSFEQLDSKPMLYMKANKTHIQRDLKPN